MDVDLKNKSNLLSVLCGVLCVAGHVCTQSTWVFFYQLATYLVWTKLTQVIRPWVLSQHINKYTLTPTFWQWLAESPIKCRVMTVINTKIWCFDNDVEWGRIGVVSHVWKHDIANWLWSMCAPVFYFFSAFFLCCIFFESCTYLLPKQIECLYKSKKKGKSRMFAS